MSDDSDKDVGQSEPYVQALEAARLRTRIAAVLARSPKPAPVRREDGTVLLRGRRRSDRSAKPVDRRSGERRSPIGDAPVA